MIVAGTLAIQSKTRIVVPIVTGTLADKEQKTLHCIPVLPFSKKIKKYFLDTLIQKIFFQIIKINIFWGELTDNSAVKEALLHTSVASLARAQRDVPLQERSPGSIGVIQHTVQHLEGVAGHFPVQLHLSHRRVGAAACMRICVGAGVRTEC